jgi:hypothetical protein
MIWAGRGRGFADERSRIACRHTGGRIGIRHGMSELTDDEPTQHQKNDRPAMENEATHGLQSNAPPREAQRSTAHRSYKQNAWTGQRRSIAFP